MFSFFDNASSTLIFTISAPIVKVLMGGLLFNSKDETILSETASTLFRNSFNAVSASGGRQLYRHDQDTAFVSARDSAHVSQAAVQADRHHHSTTPKAHEEREIDWGDRCFGQRLRPYSRFGCLAASQRSDVKVVYVGILVCVRHDHSHGYFIYGSASASGGG